MMKEGITLSNRQLKAAHQSLCDIHIQIKDAEKATQVKESICAVVNFLSELEKQLDGMKGDDDANG